MSDDGAALSGQDTPVETATVSASMEVTGERLRSIIERIERLEEEKQALADDVKEVYAEAKGTGFDVKTIRKIIRMRKQEPDQRAEEEALLETYLSAIGMI